MADEGLALCDCACACPTPEEQEAWGINCNDYKSESAVDWNLITLLFSSLVLVAIAVLAVIFLYRRSRRGKFVSEAV